MTKPKAEPMEPLIEGYLSYLAKVPAQGFPERLERRRSTMDS